MTTERAPKIAALSLQHRRGLFGIAAGGGVAVLLAGCTLPVRGTAVPIGRTTQASVLGVPNERFFPFYSRLPQQDQLGCLDASCAHYSGYCRLGEGTADNSGRGSRWFTRTRIGGCGRSDVDLVLIVTDPGTFRAETAW